MKTAKIAVCFMSDWFFVRVGRHVSCWVNMGATGASHIPNTPAAVARGNTYCQPLTMDES